LTEKGNEASANTAWAPYTSPLLQPVAAVAAAAVVAAREGEEERDRCSRKGTVNDSPIGMP